MRYQGQGEGAYGMAVAGIEENYFRRIRLHYTWSDADFEGRKSHRPGDPSGEHEHGHRVQSEEPLREATGGKPDGTWWEVLRERGLGFGRTDPAIDPQGQNIISTVMLAEQSYKQPGLTKAILGEVENTQQVLSEGGLLARLEAGQVDASSGYESAVISAKMPYIPLPDEINLSNAAYAQSWYDTVSFVIRGPSEQGNDAQATAVRFLRRSTE